MPCLPSRPVRQQLPPMRPEPFALASPRMDSTQHMAHQRAAAEAERLQRQRPVEAGSTAAELPPRTPRLPPAATAGQQPAEGSKDPVVSAPQPAGEAPHSRAASAAAAEVLRGKQQAANPEELQYLQGEPSADAGAMRVLVAGVHICQPCACIASMLCWPREAFRVRLALRLTGSTACRWRTAVGGDAGMQAAGRQPAPPHAAGPAATHRRPLRQVGPVDAGAT